MKITKTVDVAASPDDVWDYFQDVPAVAQCIPGAELTGHGDDDAYEGRLTVKLGPMTANFDGTASVSADPDTRSGTIVGTGRDRSGGSRGKLSMDYRVVPAAEGSRLEFDADVTLAGPVAQIGRQGLIDEMSGRLIEDFVRCVESRLDASDGEPAPAESSELRGFRLLLAGLVGILRSMFSRRRSQDSRER